MVSGDDDDDGYDDEDDEINIDDDDIDNDANDKEIGATMTPVRNGLLCMVSKGYTEHAS